MAHAPGARVSGVQSLRITPDNYSMFPNFVIEPAHDVSGNVNGRAALGRPPLQPQHPQHQETYSATSTFVSDCFLEIPRSVFEQVAALFRIHAAELWPPKNESSFVPQASISDLMLSRAPLNEMHAWTRFILDAMLSRGTPISAVNFRLSLTRETRLRVVFPEIFAFLAYVQSLAVYQSTGRVLHVQSLVAEPLKGAYYTRIRFDRLIVDAREVFVPLAYDSHAQGDVHADPYDLRVLFLLAVEHAAVCVDAGVCTADYNSLIIDGDDDDDQNTDPTSLAAEAAGESSVRPPMRSWMRGRNVPLVVYPNVRDTAIASLQLLKRAQVRAHIFTIMEYVLSDGTWDRQHINFAIPGQGTYYKNAAFAFIESNRYRALQRSFAYPLDARIEAELQTQTADQVSEIFAQMELWYLGWHLVYLLTAIDIQWLTFLFDENVASPKKRIKLVRAILVASGRIDASNMADPTRVSPDPVVAPAAAPYSHPSQRISTETHAQAQQYATDSDFDDDDPEELSGLRRSGRNGDERDAIRDMDKQDAYGNHACADDICIVEDLIDRFSDAEPGHFGRLLSFLVRDIIKLPGATVVPHDERPGEQSKQQQHQQQDKEEMPDAEFVEPRFDREFMHAQAERFSTHIGPYIVNQRNSTILHQLPPVVKQLISDLIEPDRSKRLISGAHTARESLAVLRLHPFFKGIVPGSRGNAGTTKNTGKRPLGDSGADHQPAPKKQQTAPSSQPIGVIYRGQASLIARDPETRRAVITPIKSWPVRYCVSCTRSIPIERAMYCTELTCETDLESSYCSVECHNQKRRRRAKNAAARHYA